MCAAGKEGQKRVLPCAALQDDLFALGHYLQELVDPEGLQFFGSIAGSFSLVVHRGKEEVGYGGITAAVEPAQWKTCTRLLS